MIDKSRFSSCLNDYEEFRGCSDDCSNCPLYNKDKD